MNDTLVVERDTRKVLASGRIVELFCSPDFQDPKWIEKLLEMLPTIVDTITDPDCADLALVGYLMESTANCPSIQEALEQRYELYPAILASLQLKILAKKYSH